MKKYVMLAVLIVMASGRASALTALEAQVRLPGDTRENYTSYLQRPDLGTYELIHPVDVRKLFSGIAKNSDAANELSHWGRESLEELYAQLSSGPFPSADNGGPVLFDGLAMLDSEGIVNRIGDLFPAPPVMLAPANAKILSFVVGRLWRGTKFVPQSGKMNHVSLSRVGNDLVTRPMILALSVGEKIETAGAKFLGVGGESYMMPAKVYCGESLVDTRRESLVMDYAYSEDVLVNGQRFSDGHSTVPPHRAMVNRNALNVRDEIRMVRPGLYLGRAYVQNTFLLNFLLYKDSGFNNDVNDDCRNPKNANAKISSY